MDDRELIGRVEAQLDELDSLGETAAADRAQATVQSIVELYGAGLARIVEAIGPAATRRLADDELVEHLLVLHGLHPVDVEARVGAALDRVRPYLGSHGGDVELLGVADGVARVRLQGSCDGCPASAMTLKLAIEDAVLKAAPDVDRVEAETEATPQSPLLQIEVRVPQPPATETVWTPAGPLAELGDGELRPETIGGERVLLVRSGEGTPYAYRPACPGCGGSLESARLTGAGGPGGELQCPSCGHRFDVVHAGRCLDAPGLALEPVPLLVDGAGLAHIALASGVV